MTSGSTRWRAIALIIAGLATAPAWTFGGERHAQPPLAGSTNDQQPSDSYRVNGVAFSLRNLKLYRHMLIVEPETFWGFVPELPPHRPWRRCSCWRKNMERRTTIWIIRS